MTGQDVLDLLVDDEIEAAEIIDSQSLLLEFSNGTDLILTQENGHLAFTAYNREDVQ